MWLWAMGGSHQLKVPNSRENPRNSMAHRILQNIIQHRRDNPCHQEGGSKMFRECGMGTAFLEPELCTKHCVRCFVSLGLKRIVEPGMYSDSHAEDEKLGQTESQSPDLSLGLMGLETHGSLLQGYCGRQRKSILHSGKLPQGRHVVVWQQGVLYSPWGCLEVPHGRSDEGSPWQWNRDGRSAYRGISGPLLGPTHRRIMGAVRSLSGAQRPEGWRYPEILYLHLYPISLHSTPHSQLRRWSPTPWSSASAGFSFNILLGREDGFPLGQRCLFPQWRHWICSK